MNDNDTGSEKSEADDAFMDSAPPASNASESSSEKPLPLATCVRWMVLGEKTVAGLFLLVIVSTMAAQGLEADAVARLARRAANAGENCLRPWTRRTHLERERFRLESK